MELATITMPGDTEVDRLNAARKAFLEYRAAVRERHSEEDAQIMRGYKALSQGKQLIHLRDTIRAGGLGEDCAEAQPLGVAVTPLVDILWEAEWQAVPPKDPALLRHLGGDLYAVVAVWDLTELERAVLGGRFE